jgi:hypothetical protein
MGSNLQPDNRTITESEIATFSNQVTKQKYVKFDHARALQLRIREKLTYEEIAERLNTTPAHVCNSLKKFLKYLEEPGDLYAYQENKPDLLETMELKLLTYLHDLLSEKKCASVKDVSLALKVVSELVRLNKGQSTSNVSVLLKSIEEAHQDPLSTASSKMETVVCPENSSSSGSSTSAETPKVLSNPTDSPAPIATLPSNVCTS